MKVWLIVVLALLGVVSRYGLPMRPAHALLPLRWSDQATQPIYENHAADCTCTFLRCCYEAPVKVSLAFDDLFLDLPVEHQPSLVSPGLLLRLQVVLDALECPIEIGQANGPSRLDPIPRQNPICRGIGPKGGFATAFS